MYLLVYFDINFKSFNYSFVKESAPPLSPNYAGLLPNLLVPSITIKGVLSPPVTALRSLHATLFFSPVSAYNTAKNIF